MGGADVPGDVTRQIMIIQAEFVVFGGDVIEACSQISTNGERPFSL